MEHLFLCWRVLPGRESETNGSTAVRAIGMTMVIDGNAQAGESLAEYEQIHRRVGAERLVNRQSIGVHMGDRPLESHARLSADMRTERGERVLEQESMVFLHLLAAVDIRGQPPLDGVEILVEVEDHPALAGDDADAPGDAMQKHVLECPGGLGDLPGDSGAEGA
jgi:hypothetical protein